MNAADGAQQRLVGFLHAARENDDSPAGECSLHDVLNARRERFERNLLGVVNFFSLGLFDERGGRLDLDDIGAELRRDLRRVCDHVERGLALLADAGAARVRPDDERQAVGLGFFANRARLLVHRLFLRRAWVDRQTNRGGAEPQSILDAGGHRWRGIFFVVENVVVINFQDERNLASILGDSRFEESERRRERVASRVDGELKVIARVVRRWIDREASRGPMLEALVHGQNDEFAGAGEFAVVEHPRQVVAHAAVIGIVVAENLTNALGHMPPPPVGSVPCSLHSYITTSPPRSEPRPAVRRLDSAIRGLRSASGSR